MMQAWLESLVLVQGVVAAALLIAGKVGSVMFARETRMGSGAYTIALSAVLHGVGTVLTKALLAAVEKRTERGVGWWILTTLWFLRTPFVPYVPALVDATFTTLAKRTVA